MEARQNNKEISPASVPNFFQDPDENQKAATVFVQPPEYEDLKTKYAALSDHLRHIKLAYLDKQHEYAKAEGDFTLMQQLRIKQDSLRDQKFSFY